MIRRPALSVIIFNKDHTSIETLYNSLEKLDKKLLARMEIDFVVYDRILSDENRQYILMIRRFTCVRFIDYNSRHDENDYKYYGRGDRFLVKGENDTITNEEIEEKLKENKERNN